MARGRPKGSKNKPKVSLFDGHREVSVIQEKMEEIVKQAEVQEEAANEREELAVVDVLLKLGSERAEKRKKQFEYVDKTPKAKECKFLFADER